VSSIIVVYSIAVFVVLKLYVGSHFDAMELSEAGKEMSRVRSLFEREIRAVGQYCADYARWDDTFRYVYGGGSGYITANYNYSSVKSQNINFITILDGDAKILFSVFYDQTGKSVPFPDIRDNSSQLRRVLSKIRAEKKDAVQGFVETSKGIMIAAVYQVTDSEVKSYTDNRLVTGRLIVKSEVDRIGDMVKSDIRMYRLSGTDKNNGVTASVSSANGVYIFKNDRAIEVYSVLNDLLGNPVSVLSLKRIMIFSEKGKFIVNIAVLILFGCGIVVLFAMIVMLKRGVISPLERIEADTREIALSEDFSRTIPENRSDEIGVLTNTFNSMIRKLADVNLTLERKVLERTSELAQANAELVLLAKVFESSLEGILITDAKGMFVKVNPAFTKITGFHKEDIAGNEVWMLKSERHTDKFYEDIRNSVASNGRWSGEIWAMNRRGRVYPQWISINTIKNETGEITNYIAIFHDISEFKRQESYIKYQAYHDTLTGLPNRVLLTERMCKAIERNSELGKKFAILFLDLDRFKNINDSMGHEYGDILLQHVAERLERLSRISDTVARLGGDEFIIMIEDFEKDNQPAVLAERIIESFKNPFVIKGEMFHIGTSIGIAIYPDDGTECGILMRNADTAMYRAKEEGRLRYSHFTPSLNEKVSQRMQIENDLEIAIARDDFEVYFQPILNMSNGKIDRFEALARWNRGGKLLCPCEFIPVAEETGFVTGIDRLVMEKTFRKIRVMNEGRESAYTVSLNISLKTISRDDFSELFRAAFQGAEILPSWIMIEISGEDYRKSPEKIDSVISDLRDQGVMISLDNFGEGHFSMPRIADLKISSIKIDRSFIRNIDNGSDDAGTIDRIMSMTHDRGISVTALGIETSSQFKYVSGLGCDFAQGFYISEPVPFEKAMAFIESYRPAG
jgi:diguanylate cyclase (GGDEF)-like protein/PAS domain S-box-containing protein